MTKRELDKMKSVFILCLYFDFSEQNKGQNLVPMEVKLIKKIDEKYSLIYYISTEEEEIINNVDIYTSKKIAEKAAKNKNLKTQYYENTIS